MSLIGKIVDYLFSDRCHINIIVNIIAIIMFVIYLFHIKGVVPLNKAVPYILLGVALGKYLVWSYYFIKMDYE